MIKASPFSFRDTIQYILPTLIGLALFCPYFASSDSIEIIFIGGALISYLIHTPVKLVVEKIYKHTPILGKKITQIKTDMNWWSHNWNYDKLFYENIDDKEREYIYLTAGYADFHRITSFYLLCYFVVQVISLFKTALLIDSSMLQIIITLFNINIILPMGDLFETILKPMLDLETDIIGGLKIPTYVAALISGILFVASIRDYLIEARDVANMYVRFAEKYHRKNGGLAEGIWGWVKSDEEPLIGARVLLVHPNGNIVKETKTDKEGKFQFPGLLDEASAGVFSVVTKKNHWESHRQVSSDKKAVPAFTFIKIQEQANGS